MTVLSVENLTISYRTARRWREVQQVLRHRDLVTIVIARQVTDVELDRLRGRHAAVLRSLRPE